MTKVTGSQIIMTVANIIFCSNLHVNDILRGCCLIFKEWIQVLAHLVFIPRDVFFSCWLEWALLIWFDSLNVDNWSLWCDSVALNFFLCLEFNAWRWDSNQRPFLVDDIYLNQSNHASIQVRWFWIWLHIIAEDLDYDGSYKHYLKGGPLLVTIKVIIVKAVESGAFLYNE